MPEKGAALVVLAAGRGARYAASGGAGHKLSARFRGGTIAGWAIDHAVAAEAGPVYVVIGTVELAVPPDVHLIRNPDWADGMATSLHAALRVIGREGHRVAVVGLGDQPMVEPEAWRLVERARGPISVATYGGRRGHPVRLASEVWPLLPTHGDEGARPVMREHPELVVEVPCPGQAADVDTTEDLSRWS